ncbi:hypothetical protein [Simkania negevensis]|uniref:Uncharacterized protein n=1 Tax=Simkania negevensis (strain ATCC VR-1471 / DSM 27360 / Z) TaxID=331113 RepID=F8L3K5_SIMNZ|nr:hypothetical protein [Simkania negevensis]MCB1067917.1 hypothetical protein [Simkania sp.]MCP5489592.1 hypothetical protein [Chlamydiales bacterium]CCB89864.1 unknown protein [Simkania negevensis Z]
MTELVYNTQQNWEAQENQTFESMLHKLGSFSSAGQALMYVGEILYFMIGYYQGEGEWNSSAQSDLANTDLYDMQWIENGFAQTAGQAIMGNDSVNQTPVVNAYAAANNMLMDLYTNPIFDGTKIPQEALNNLCTIFGTKDYSTQSVQVEIDGQQVTKQVPQFNTASSPQGTTEWTTTIWDGAPASNNYQPFQSGDASYQGWVDQMQQMEQSIQETNTLFTNMNASEQSEAKFYAGEDKQFEGITEQLLKNITSLQQTELKNQLN